MHIQLNFIIECFPRDSFDLVVVVVVVAFVLAALIPSSYYS